jgi:FKBP-type peptidyl-prolyl cis-trans isomerase FkpA
MRKILLCLTVVALLTSGCLKKTTGCAYSESTTVAPTAEQQAVLDYLTANSITASKHSSGLYYKILADGTGGSPQICSQVQVNYKGTLTNNSTFDENNNFVYDLGALIDGWKKGIPLIKKGGHIMLYIPPTLGYGSTDVKNASGVVVIPANSILVFDITLIDFN